MDLLVRPEQTGEKQKLPSSMMLYRLTAEIMAQIRGGIFPAQSIWITNISCIKKKERTKERN